MPIANQSLKDLVEQIARVLVDNPHAVTFSYTNMTLPTKA
jgi:predicted RNA-binding protein YlqC (UPF0109 family)